MAPDRPELRGWCLDSDTVWLWAADGPPVAAPCRHPRADLEAVGLPLFCGFVVPIEALGRPEDLLGQRLWASVDAEGLRPLPQMQAWILGAELLLRIHRLPLLALGDRLLREQGPVAAMAHFAEALLDDPGHAAFHERLRYCLFRQEETSVQSCDN